MTSTTFNSIATAMLLAILCSFSNVNATATTSALINSATTATASTPVVLSTKKVEGGPREIIQLRTSVQIVQSEKENLSITIVDGNGEVVYQETTTSKVTNINVGTWAEGDYTIETSCDHEDYQEFYFYWRG